MSALNAHEAWQANWPDYQPDASLHVDPERFQRILEEFQTRLGGNYPFFHPLYAGQMLKPPHPAAMIGYLAAMLINPNNHALDGGPPTARMETECIDLLAQSMGFQTWLGHLTGGGTMANLEALWVSRQLHPDKAIVFSDQAHYTHARMCSVIQAPYHGVASLPDGRMDVSALASLLERESVGTVVATLGTTSLGSIDPLGDLLALQARYGFRIHVDAAYGGYYHLLSADEAFREFRWLGKADSVVIDPHKQGLQPYGCGCVIFKDPEVARFYGHASPYTYYSSPERHLGEISLECSRPGAAAAALWLTMQCFPLAADTGMGAILRKNRLAALSLAKSIHESARFSLYLEPAMDIVTYFSKAKDTQTISQLTDRIFARGMADGGSRLYLAKLQIPGNRFAQNHPGIQINTDTVTMLRSCLLKPEHAAWVPEIMARLEALLG